jgi:hypothetical protein
VTTLRHKPQSSEGVLNLLPISLLLCDGWGEKSVRGKIPWKCDTTTVTADMERTWEVLYESPLPGFGNKTGVSYLRATQEVIEVYCQENCVMIRQDLAKGLGGVVWDCVRYKIFSPIIFS